MLTGEIQDNKDFDINNLYLNLTFQEQTEHFEYKKPLIDQISNYQLIVTKFHSKTSVPFIRLHDSKKNTNTLLYTDFSKLGTNFSTKNFNYYYDYYVEIQYQTKYNNIKFINQNLYKLIDPYKFYLEKEEKPVVIETSLDAKKEITNQKYIDINYDYPSTNKKYWNFITKENEIYSPSQLLGIINYSIQKAFERFFQKDFENEGEFDSTYLTTIKEYRDKYKNIKYMYYYIENGKLMLKIHEEFLYCLNTYYDTQEMFSEVEKIKANQIYMRVCFSRNLFKYLKSIHLTLQKENSNLCYLEISRTQQLNAKIEHDIILVDKELYTEKQEITYRVFEGEEINMIDWSDYIGIAVTTPDFPIRRQIYPHFFHEPGSIDNRKRYIPKSEENIASLKTALTGETDIKKEILKEENIKELYKNNMKEGIIFLKYFDRNDDINNINYENNNIDTGPKLDIERFIPLQEFTMQIWLIDKYNNFEPLNIYKKELDDIIQMQILLRRIRGAEEKENRIFIDVLELAKRPQITDPEQIEQIYKRQRYQEKIMQRIHEMSIYQPEPITIAEEIPEMSLSSFGPQFKPIKEEYEDDYFSRGQEKEEKGGKPPPEKKIYIKKEPEDEDEINPEDKLY